MKALRFKTFKNNDFYKESLEIMAIANRGVAQALRESQEMGIPTVHAIMDSIFYRMPDGTITTKSPFKKQRKSNLSLSHLAKSKCANNK